jgi:epoxyqueuosine reductase
VCPWNRRAPIATEKSLQPKSGANPATLAELFALDDAALRERFIHTPLWRRRRRGILRNAAVVLGNRPHQAALPALLQGIEDTDPVIRTACAWALGRYANEPAREALCRRLAVEPDREAREEIEAALRQCKDD